MEILLLWNCIRMLECEPRQVETRAWGVDSVACAVALCVEGSSSFSKLTIFCFFR